MAQSLKALLQMSLLTAIVAAVLSLGGCGCGFDCNNGRGDGDNGDTALLDLGFSDALPEELTEVVIQVESITLRRSDGDVVINTFTIADLELEDAENFQVNMLDYPGARQLLVVQDLEVASGAYNGIFIEISATDPDGNDSYVTELESGERKPLVLSGGGLALRGFELSAGEQAYTIEFELARSLDYQAQPDNYLLTTEGFRVVNSITSASLSGIVDPDLFDTVTQCDEKLDPLVGNRLYLYQGAGLNIDSLSDVFNDDSREDIPSGAIAPFAVSRVFFNQVTGNWDYAFGFLPAGDYTLVFACDTEDDDSVDYDGLTVPLPAEQLYEINLENRENATCNLGDELSC